MIVPYSRTLFFRSRPRAGRTVARTLPRRHWRSYASDRLPSPALGWELRKESGFRAVLHDDHTVTKNSVISLPCALVVLRAKGNAQYYLRANGPSAKVRRRQMRLRTILFAATFLASPVVAGAQPITGLYIGGGVGANFTQQECWQAGLRLVRATTMLS
jgi:hypothetical protein